MGDLEDWNTLRKEHWTLSLGRERRKFGDRDS
jgi:hypothetical protein